MSRETSKFNVREIGRATLVEIRKQDGAQKYRMADGKVEWLTGITRASDVKVGDSGVMVYESSPSHGLLFFRKDKGNRSSLTLFYDGSEDSNKARLSLQEREEPCYYCDTRLLNVAKGDEIEAPLLFAPEGIFCGWKKIQLFLNIPVAMRHENLGRSVG